MIKISTKIRFSKYLLRMPHRYERCRTPREARGPWHADVGRRKGGASRVGEDRPPSVASSPAG